MNMNAKNINDLSIEERLDLILHSLGVLAYHVGISYSEGGWLNPTENGGVQDHQKAMDLYREAAMLGNTDAVYVQGVAYASGLGVPRNLSIACELYKIAADAGHGAAAMNLGLSYLNAWGVENDPEMGEAYIRRAAELGNLDAIEYLRFKSDDTAFTAVS